MLTSKILHNFTLFRLTKAIDNFCPSLSFMLFCIIIHSNPHHLDPGVFLIISARCDKSFTFLQKIF